MLAQQGCMKYPMEECGGPEPQIPKPKLCEVEFLLVSGKLFNEESSGKKHGSTLRLYWDNGKKNGNYYNSAI